MANAPHPPTGHQRPLPHQKPPSQPRVGLPVWVSNYPSVGDRNARGTITAVIHTGGPNVNVRVKGEIVRATFIGFGGGMCRLSTPVAYAWEQSNNPVAPGWDWSLGPKPTGWKAGDEVPARLYDRRHGRGK